MMNKHGFGGCTLQNLGVRDPVIPGEAQDPLEATDVEHSQGPDLLAKHRPGFTAMEEH